MRFIIISFICLLGNNSFLTGSEKQSLTAKRIELLEKNSVFIEWTGFYSKYDPELKWGQLNISQVDTIREKRFFAFAEFKDIGEIENSLRKPLLSYSSDRKRFIDPYLGMSLSEEKGSLVMAWDADQAVCLFDKQDITTTKLFSSGTGSRVGAVAWINNTTCVLFGTEVQFPDSLDNGHRAYHFFILWCDLASGIRTMYDGPTMEWKHVASMKNQYFISKEMKRLRKKYKNIKE